MGAMKLPRFGLKTLFLVVTLSAVTLGWGYQLNWIRQRHEYLAQFPQCDNEGATLSLPELPWSLRLLGETRRHWLYAQNPRNFAQSLFPEALVLTGSPD